MISAFILANLYLRVQCSLLLKWLFESVFQNCAIPKCIILLWGLNLEGIIITSILITGYNSPGYWSKDFYAV